MTHRYDVEFDDGDALTGASGDELTEALRGSFGTTGIAYEDDETGDVTTVGDVIDALIRHLRDGEPTDAEESMLGIRVHVVG